MIEIRQPNVSMVHHFCLLVADKSPAGLESRRDPQAQGLCVGFVSQGFRISLIEQTVSRVIPPRLDDTSPGLCSMSAILGIRKVRSPSSLCLCLNCAPILSVSPAVRDFELARL